MKALPGVVLRCCAGARERDPVVTLEDVDWGVDVALSVALFNVGRSFPSVG